jgi:transglutaminase/protease-like cytokinesis protein 3
VQGVKFMHIPSYQINNVIKVYSKQISQNRLAERQKSLGSDNVASADNITISDEGKRQTIINKVSEDILDRITQYGPKNETEQEIVERLNQEISGKLKGYDTKDQQFVFNFIGENNEKITSTLSVEDSKIVSRRLEQLVKETIDKTMES